jgi:glycosyltransferase involved in cell wall biosynthesis
MVIDVLVSTMNRTEKESLIKKMNIKGSATIINQVTKADIAELINDKKDLQKMYSFREKGLSRSRNKAIQNSSGDICILADDDLVYVDEYEKIVKAAYEKYTDADIIVFYVSSDNKLNQKAPLKEGKINYITSMKVQSVQVTFKKDSIIEKEIKFDENFGTGTSNYMGEENIFLFDALKNGLKIVSLPVKIANIIEGESSWFKGYTKEYFIVKSKVFKRMSRKMWLILVLQFVIRKRNLYKGNMTLIEVLKCMLKIGSEI